MQRLKEKAGIDESSSPVPLRLKYTPSVETASRFAADIVASAAEISGVHLDYSFESLQAVDDLLEAMRRDGMTSGRMGETMFGFGCYIGDVLVRSAGARWVDAAATDMNGIEPPMVVQLPSGRPFNAIGLAFGRLDEGSRLHLPSICRSALTSPKAPSLNADRERVLPRLVSAAFVQGRGAGLCRRPVDGTDLHSVYCTDEVDVIKYIPAESLGESGMDVEALHALALTNLAGRTEDVAAVIRRVLDDNTMVVLKTLDSYDAARLLLVPAALRPGESVIAHVPDRDTLALMPPVSEERRGQVVETLRQVPPDPERALLDRPMIVRPSGFELL
jgi:hypothetical protein